MSPITTIILIIVVAILISVSGGFITKAAADLKKTTTNGYRAQARQFLIIASSLTWTTLVINIIMIIIGIFDILLLIGVLGKILLYGSVLVLIAAAVLSGWAAYDLYKAKDTTTSYHNAIIGASIAGGSSLFLFIVGLISHHRS